MGLAGCGPTWQQRLARTASVQHNCPIERVQVLTLDQWDAVYAVSVCGERRIYQPAGLVYVDQTPEHDEPSPPLSSTSGGAEGVFARTIRSRIDATRSNVLACTGGPTAVVAEWSVGQVRISVRGETDVAVAQCVASAIGTIDVPRGTVQGRLIHPVAP